MKQLYAALLVVCLTLSGCGNDKIIEGKNYGVFGVINEDEVRDPKVVYEVSVGSVLVAVIFCETVVVPVYVIGWDLFQPVRLRQTVRFNEKASK